MKKVYKLLGILALSVLSLSACATNKTDANVEKYDVSTPQSARVIGMDNGLFSSENKFVSTINSNLTKEQKLVITADVYMNSDDVNLLTKDIKDIISDKKGFIDSSSMSANDDGITKSSYIEARIPKDKYEDFINTIKEKGTIYSFNEDATDISLDYNDIEGQIQSLDISIKKLDELLSQAKDVNDIVTIEKELSENRQKFDFLMSNKNRYDDKLEYNTININVFKKAVFIDDKDKTFLERVKSTIHYSMQKINEFGITLLVGLIGGIPLIILGFILIIISLIIIGLLLRFLLFIAGIRKKKK